MTGTISFGGIGSGLDTEGIVQGLVGASSGKLNSLKSQVANTDAATSTMSSIARNLSSLSSAASALATVRDASAYAATSSNSAVVSTVTGSALPGSFSVDVVALAREQRTYSRSFASNTTALAQTGTITLQIGAESAEIDVTATDTLESIATKVNGAGLRASASVFFDGTTYRLQVRGLDTGAANALTFTESGTDLDLNGDGVDPAGGKTYQQASDAVLRIDGYTVTRPTNQIAGAISGVTLALTKETTETATVTIASDTERLKTSLQAVVDAFNGVVSGVHLASGFGSMKATNQVLAGDYALRTVTDRLARTVYSSATGSDAFSMLAEVGLSLKSGGTLALDVGKLTSAVQSDAAGVASLIAQKMSSIDKMVSEMIDSQSGVFALRKEALESQSKNLGLRVDREQAWLDRYGESLRKRFTAMDVALGTQMSNIEQLLKMTD